MSPLPSNSAISPSPFPFGAPGSGLASEQTFCPEGRPPHIWHACELTLSRPQSQRLTLGVRFPPQQPRVV